MGESPLLLRWIALDSKVKLKVALGVRFFPLASVSAGWPSVSVRKPNSVVVVRGVRFHLYAFRAIAALDSKITALSCGFADLREGRKAA